MTAGATSKKAGEILGSFGGRLAEAAAARPAAAPPAPVAAAAPPSGVTRLRGAAMVPIGRIGVAPGQPREDFDDGELAALADSFRRVGILQPLRLRPAAAGDGVAYWLVVGERRFRAALAAGLAEVPAIVHDGELDAATLFEIQLVENLHRSDLNPIEEARGYRELMAKSGESARGVARRLGLDAGRVARALRLLDLPPELQAKVRSRELAASTAYEVAKAPEADRPALAARAAEGTLRRDEAAAARSPAPHARRGRSTARFRVDGGTVAVTLDGPADPAAVVAALEAALRRARDGEATTP